MRLRSLDELGGADAEAAGKLAHGVLIETGDPGPSHIVTEMYDWARDPYELRGNPRLRTSAQRARYEAMKDALERATGCAGAECP